MQRQLQVRAVLEVGDGVHKRVVDTNAFHDDEVEAGSPVATGFGATGENVGQCDEAAPQWAAGQVKPVRGAGSSRTVVETHRLGRLTERKNNNGNVSSALAWDDLNDIKLLAGMFKEARGK